MSDKIPTIMIICRVFRAATGAGKTGDYAEVDFHYEIDSFGSDSEYIK